MGRLLALLRRKRVWIPLAVFTAYTLFGFLILPGILRGQIIRGIRENLMREARLTRVRVNPLIFSLTLEGFELRDPDGTPFVTFDRLYVDYQLSSLLRWAVTFREVRLDRLAVHARLMPDGRPNFADLAQPKADRVQPKAQGKPPRLVVGSLRLRESSARLTNLMAAEPEEGTIAPIDLTLKNFTTIPQKEGLYQLAATDPGNGAWRWKGEVTFEPMHSAGVVEITGSRLRLLREIAKNRVPFDITGGELGCRLYYAVDVRGDSLAARVQNSSVSLTGFRLREKGGESDLLQLDTLAVTGIDVRYPEQAATIGRVLVAGARVQAWRNPDSTLNWLSMLPRPRPPVAIASEASATPAPGPPAGSPGPSPPPARQWTLTLGELAVRDMGVHLEDRTTEPPFEVTVAPINATLRNLSSRPGTTFDVAADATIAERGRLAASGTVAALPPAADLTFQLENLPLPIFQPYVNPRAKLQLVSGTLHADGAVQFRDGKGRPEARFKGRVQSGGFLTRDRIVNDRFLSWKSLTVNAIDYAPARVGVGSVRIVEPFAKLIVHKDRTTNVQDILGLPTEVSTASGDTARAVEARGGKKGAKAQPKPSEALAATKQMMTSAPPVPIRIDRVEIVHGSADFADLSLILPFAARIEELGGTVAGLSSDSSSHATVALDGQLRPSGTAKVRGEVNPLAADPTLNLAIVFQGFNLPTLTPYSGEFLGREIDKGRMSLDLGYRLQGRHLVGGNKVLLDQLELGKKVESPEATSLPVGLAIAILKDGEGKIDLDVPVEGDLDDPEFRIGKVIWHFIMSLLKKVAMAPFKLLGGLFGGGGGEEELGHVDFAAGASAVPEDQVESLSKLAQALGKRPNLRLEVRGRTDADVDAAAIRKSKFATFAGERMAANPKRYGSGLGYSGRLLEDLCVERLGKEGLAAIKESHKVAAGDLDAGHPQFKAGSKKIVVDDLALHAAIQDTLTTLQRVDEADLLALANARADSIQVRLVGYGVEEARVYVLDPEAGKGEDGRVRVDLSLTD